MKIKKIFLPYGVMFIMFLIVADSNEVLNVAKESLIICFSAIIPSLFPFMVLSSYLVTVTEKNTFFFLESLTKKLFGLNSRCITPMLCGLICGFPVGAKCSGELYRQNHISQSEAESLIAFSNNPSPMFVIGVVGIGLFKSIELGIMLYMVQLFSALCTAMVLKNFTTHTFTQSSFMHKPKKDLSSSICDSVSSVLCVCGFVIFFAVITHLLSPICSLMPKEISALIYCITEITNGIHYTCSLNLDITTRITFASFALAWSGFSVHMQVKSLISDTELSMKKYYISKGLSCVFSALVTFLIFKYHDSIFLFIASNELLLFVFIFCIITHLIKPTKVKNFEFVHKKRNPFYGIAPKTNFLIHQSKI